MYNNRQKEIESCQELPISKDVAIMTSIEEICLKSYNGKTALLRIVTKLCTK